MNEVFTLCRVVDVKSSPVPGVRHETLWTGSTDPQIADADLSHQAVWFILHLRRYAEVDRIEWDQIGRASCRERV